MSDIFKLMFSTPACVTHEDDVYVIASGYTEFFIVVHEEDVYVVAGGYAYAKIVDVR